MDLKYESQVRPPLVSGQKNYHQITEDIVRPIEDSPSRLWWIGFLISVALLTFGIISVTHEVIYGVGQWNLNKTVGWGWDITNFVWWVGIGHAGTLISAILLLFRQGQSAVSAILSAVGGMYEDNLYLSTLYEYLGTPVAPAIGEALITTAIGLAAAIPAVFFYNWIDKRVGDFVAELEGAAAEWVALVAEQPLRPESAAPYATGGRFPAARQRP